MLKFFFLLILEISSEEKNDVWIIYATDGKYRNKKFVNNQRISLEYPSFRFQYLIILFIEEWIKKTSKFEYEMFVARNLWSLLKKSEP